MWWCDGQAGDPDAVLWWGGGQIGHVFTADRVFVKKPYNFVTRRLVKRWSGAGEGRRPGEPRGLHGKD